MADQSQSIEVRDEAAKAALARVPGVLFKRMNSAFQVHGQEFDREMQLRNRVGGGGTHRRTGRLARSIGYRVSGSGLPDLALRVFSSGVSYAKLQEYGGTIRPKPPRQFLTVPMPDNLTAAGVPRYPSAADLRATQPGKTFVFRKDGKLFIGYQPSAKAALQVLWKLVRSVTVPPRFGFRDTWARHAPNRAARQAKAVDLAVKEAVSTP